MGLRHPLLIHTFVFYVSHLDVARQPHLCNLPPGPAWKSCCPRRPNTHTHTQRQERMIMVLGNYSYLWASVSKWDNYRHPLTGIYGFLPLFQGPGNHCHVGLFMPKQWEGFDLLMTAKFVCCKKKSINFLPAVDKCKERLLPFYCFSTFAAPSGEIHLSVQCFMQQQTKSRL